MKSKRQLALEIARMCATPGRHYDQDLREVFAHQMSRPIAAVRETWERQTAIAAVTPREIARHCQTAGLPGFKR